MSKPIRVQKLSRRRSVNNKHRHLPTTRTRSEKIIHITIRPSYGIQSINNNSIRTKNTLHSISNNINSDEHQHQTTNSSSTQNIVKQRDNKEPPSIPSVEQYSHSTFPSRRKSCTNDRINVQMSESSAKTNTNKTYRTTSNAARSRKGSSKVASHRNMTISDCNNSKRQNAWFDDIDTINDHHQNAKKKKTKKCTKQGIVASVIGALIIVTVLVITLPVVFLTKPKRITTNTEIPLLRWNRNGITVIGTTGQPGNTSSQFYWPWDIAVDWTNSLYVSDEYNNRVQKVLMGMSNATTIAGYGNGTGSSSLYGLNKPLGIIVDENSKAYVSDYSNNRVVVWSNGALSASLIAGNGTAGNSMNLLNAPYGLARDANSDAIYVAEYNNNRVMRFFPNNASGTLVAGGNGNGINDTQLSAPHAVHFDSLTNSLLIANTVANNIVRWALGANNWTLVAGSINGTSDSTSTYLSIPSDVTLDPMDNMYVADRSNHRIQFFPPGELSATTIAGQTGISGKNTSLLNTPCSLTLDSQLNLYVVDRANHRIQKFSRY